MIENIGPLSFFLILKCLFMSFFKKITKNQSFFIAEIGINHNGDIKNALKLIESAKLAGCDAVKFQKRTPKITTPKSSWDIMREMPWGKMKCIDYKKKLSLKKKNMTLLINIVKKLILFGLLHVGMCPL